MPFPFANVTWCTFLFPTISCYVTQCSQNIISSFSPSFLFSLFSVTLEKDFGGITIWLADCCHLSSLPIEWLKSLFRRSVKYPDGLNDSCRMKRLYCSRNPVKINALKLVGLSCSPACWTRLYNSWALDKNILDTFPVWHTLSRQLWNTAHNSWCFVTGKPFENALPRSLANTHSNSVHTVMPYCHQICWM